jgi:hypothetical protein
MDTTETAAAALLCLALGFVCGIMISNRKAPSPRLEPPASAIIHAEGSITLERTNQPAPPPLPRPPEAKDRTRAAELDLKPMDEPSKIQVDIVETKDGGERITAKGPALIGGLDFPLPPRPIPPVKNWTLGGGYGANTYSIFALREWRGLELGGIIQQSRINHRNLDAQILIAIKF